MPSTPILANQHLLLPEEIDILTGGPRSSISADSVDIGVVIERVLGSINAVSDNSSLSLSDGTAGGGTGTNGDANVTDKARAINLKEILSERDRLKSQSTIQLRNQSQRQGREPTEGTGETRLYVSSGPDDKDRTIRALKAAVAAAAAAAAAASGNANGNGNKEGGAAGKKGGVMLVFQDDKEVAKVRALEREKAGVKDGNKERDKEKDERGSREGARSPLGRLMTFKPTKTFKSFLPSANPSSPPLRSRTKSSPLPALTSSSPTTKATGATKDPKKPLIWLKKAASKPHNDAAVKVVSVPPILPEKEVAPAPTPTPPNEVSNPPLQPTRNEKEITLPPTTANYSVDPSREEDVKPESPGTPPLPFEPLPPTVTPPPPVPTPLGRTTKKSVTSTPPSLPRKSAPQTSTSTSPPRSVPNKPSPAKLRKSPVKAKVEPVASTSKLQTPPPPSPVPAPGLDIFALAPAPPITAKRVKKTKGKPNSDSTPLGAQSKKSDVSNTPRMDVLAVTEQLHELTRRMTLDRDFMPDSDSMEELQDTTFGPITRSTHLGLGTPERPSRLRTASYPEGTPIPVPTPPHHQTGPDSSESDLENPFFKNGKGYIDTPPRNWVVGVRSPGNRGSPRNGGVGKKRDSPARSRRASAVGVVVRSGDRGVRRRVLSESSIGKKSGAASAAAAGDGRLLREKLDELGTRLAKDAGAVVEKEEQTRTEAKQGSEGRASQSASKSAANGLSPGGTTVSEGPPDASTPPPEYSEANTNASNPVLLKSLAPAVRLKKEWIKEEKRILDAIADKRRELIALEVGKGAGGGGTPKAKVRPKSNLAKGATGTRTDPAIPNAEADSTKEEGVRTPKSDEELEVLSNSHFSAPGTLYSQTWGTSEPDVSSLAFNRFAAEKGAGQTVQDLTVQHVAPLESVRSDVWKASGDTVGLGIMMGTNAAQTHLAVSPRSPSASDVDLVKLTKDLEKAATLPLAAASFERLIHPSKQAAIATETPRDTSDPVVPSFTSNPGVDIRKPKPPSSLRRTPKKSLARFNDGTIKGGQPFISLISAPRKGSKLASIPFPSRNGPASESAISLETGTDCDSHDTGENNKPIRSRTIIDPEMWNNISISVGERTAWEEQRVARSKSARSKSAETSREAKTVSGWSVCKECGRELPFADASIPLKSEGARKSYQVSPGHKMARRPSSAAIVEQASPLDRFVRRFALSESSAASTSPTNRVHTPSPSSPESECSPLSFTSGSPTFSLSLGSSPMRPRGASGGPEMRPRTRYSLAMPVLPFPLPPQGHGKPRARPLSAELPPNSWRLSAELPRPFSFLSMSSDSPSSSSSRPTSTIVVEPSPPPSLSPSPVPTVMPELPTLALPDEADLGSNSPNFIDSRSLSRASAATQVSECGYSSESTRVDSTDGGRRPVDEDTEEDEEFYEALEKTSLSTIDNRFAVPISL